MSEPQGRGAAAADVPQLTPAEAAQYTVTSYLDGWVRGDRGRGEPGDLSATVAA